MDKITPINVNCGISKTIPLAFDESLSFLELLYAMNNKLTEAINNLNVIIDEYENIDANFDEVYRQIQETRDYSYALFTSLRSELINYSDSTLSQAVSGLRATIDNVYHTLDTKIDNTVVGEIDVYNPTNAQIENINKVLSDIYNVNRIYAITCTEYDSLELTATEYDAKQIMAFDFDNYSLEIL